MTRALPLLVVLLAACGGGPGDEPGAVTTGGDEADAPAAITASDSGESFQLAPGEEVSLRLSGDYVWSEPAAQGGAVELSRVDYFQDPGFSEWTVRAVGAGSATISSAGEPACAGQHDCPDDPVRFRVTITVAG